MPYGRGFRFKGWSPGWPYVGRGRGGLPRCWAYGPYPYGADFALGFSGPTPWYGSPPMAPEFGLPMPPEQEKQMLQYQVAFLRDQMNQISKRIEELEKEWEGKSQ